MHQPSLTFTQLFGLLVIAFVALFAANALQAWTGPTAAPPSGNVPAPINVNSSDQTKVGGLLQVFNLWVNGALGVTGGATIGGKLGVSTTTPSQPLSVGGIIYSGNGGFKFPDGTVQTTAAGGSSGGQLHIQEFTSSGTFTTPLGTSAGTVYKFTIVGGGGGGGSANQDYSGNIYPGGGGGGGAAAIYEASGVTAGTNITITVGGSGAGVLYSSGTAGGFSRIVFNGVTVTANGGGGGNGVEESFGAPGTGGTATNGTININAESGQGDNGGDSALGYGGGGTASSVIGTCGSATGYGGGGSGAPAVLWDIGCPGAPGIVYVEWNQ